MASRVGWSVRAGRPTSIRSREQLVVPGGCLRDVSQRERPHPNKRLKLSAPRAPAGGAAQATQPAIRKSLISSAAAVRAAA